MMLGGKLVASLSPFEVAGDVTWYDRPPVRQASASVNARGSGQYCPRPDRWHALTTAIQVLHSAHVSALYYFS
jgi:hypothetical protein